MLQYVIQATNVSFVQINGFTIAGSRGAGVEVFNSSNVFVSDLFIVDMGTIGVNIFNLFI